MDKKQIKNLVTLLNKCPSDALPEEVFIAFTRLTVMTAIEFVPLKKIEDGVEVLLTPRAQDDPFWPGMLHTPGTILRPTDRTFEDAFNRLFSNELPELAKIKPQFIGTHYGRGSRGSGVTFEYILDVTHDTRSDYKYYPVAELPNNFIPEQRGLVERAVEKLTQNN